MEILFFFFVPLYCMTVLMQEALPVFSLFIQQLRCGFIQILLAQSSAQKKIRNGEEFQQRGQKNSANSLQMCLWAVWGNTVLPSLERKRRKFNELRAKNSSTAQYSWFWLSGYGEEKGGNPGTHTVVSTLWKNCWYAESHECTLVMLKAKTQSLLGFFFKGHL